MYKCSFELCIHQRLLKKTKHRITVYIKYSTTVFSIDNSNIYQ